VTAGGLELRAACYTLSSLPSRVRVYALVEWLLLPHCTASQAAVLQGNARYTYGGTTHIVVQVFIPKE
jgi:hypothetical protein